MVGFETGGEAVRPTLIALRNGDSMVEALRAAGRGRLVIVRVLPMIFQTTTRGSLASPAIEPWERMEAIERTAQRRLAELVGRRRPAPQLVIRFGDPAEQVAAVVADTRADRVIAPSSLARKLAGAVAVPVISAEEGVDVSRRDTIGEAVGRLRRALGRPVDEKLAALQGMELFSGVDAAELRRLASLLDLAEVGPGQVLTREGRLNDALWIVLDGTAERSIGGRQIGCLGPQSLVGAPSMIYGQPAIATVTARQPVRALVAGRVQFQSIAALDNVALRLKAATADRLRDYLRAGERATASGTPWGMPVGAH